MSIEDGQNGPGPRIPVELRPRGAARWLPFLSWARSYSRAALRRDLYAGSLVALVSIPSALGYAQLAGVGPAAGLYAIALSGIVFTVFSSSRQLAVGPTGIVSVMVAVGIGAPAVGEERAAVLAGTLGLMVGALLVIGAALRVGFVTQFISRPVALGYALGTVITILAAELGSVLGVELARRRFLPAMTELFASLGRVELIPALFGLGMLGLFALFRKVHASIAPLATLVAATASVFLFRLQEVGVRVVGEIPAARLKLTWPTLAWSDLQMLAPTAVAIAVYVLFDSTTVARSLAARAGDDLRPDQELLALGAMNAASGLGGGFPVGGNTGDSGLSESLRARTPFAGLVVVVLAIAVLLIGPTLPRLPWAALSVIAIGGVLAAFPWSLLPRIFLGSRAEFVLMGVAVVGVLLIGPIRGLVIAAFASMLHLIWVASHPRTAQLGVLPSRPDVFVDLARSPGARPIPFVLVYRVEVSLFFSNIERVSNEILALVADRSQPTRVVVLDLTPVNLVDLTAYLGLEKLEADLARQKIRFVAANARASLASSFVQLARVGGALGPDFGQGDVRSAIARAEALGPPTTPGR